MAGSSTRAQRRARNIAAFARVNLPTNIARLSIGGAIIEGPVTPLGEESLFALTTSTRRWRQPRPVEVGSGAPPAAPPDVVDEPMGETDEPVYADAFPVMKIWFVSPTSPRG